MAARRDKKISGWTRRPIGSLASAKWTITWERRSTYSAYSTGCPESDRRRYPGTVTSSETRQFRSNEEVLHVLGEKL